MIKDVLSHIGGVGVYGVISLTLFFLVFSGTVIWACSLRRSYMDRMSRLPMEDGTEPDSRVESGTN